MRVRIAGYGGEQKLLFLAEVNAAFPISILEEHRRHPICRRLVRPLEPLRYHECVVVIT